MSGTLYLLPNAISDESVEAVLPSSVLEIARSVDIFLVEAAKTSRAAIKAMGHPKPIAELTIEEIGHDPDPDKIDGWLAPVLEGKDAAILSESGCPGIADPGAQIAARAHALGIPVKPLVGPSSILLALMASGLDGQRFRFLGYLPIHDDERRQAILSIEKASRASETQLFIETPYRNTQMLAALLETLHDETRLTVATDITGRGETIRTMTASEWRAASLEARTLPKLPTVFALLTPADRARRYAPVNAARKGNTEDGKNISAKRFQKATPHRRIRGKDNRNRR